MIVLDIETTGLDMNTCSIWQIGAIDLFNPEQQFLQEARVEPDTEIKPDALQIIGKTKQQLLDTAKQTEKQLLENFFNWIKDRKVKNFICQNPQFDLAFIQLKADQYKLQKPFHYRAFDVHTLAQTKYFEIHKKFLIGENFSEMNLKSVLQLVGIVDQRKAHNALEDAKLTAEAFNRLIFKKNLLSDYSNCAIPENIK